jgi:hypothetical protein
MALITFPDIINPTNLSFGIQGSSQAFVSEFTGTSQHVRLPTARWYGSANWENLTGDDFDSLKVFLTQLEGAFNTFAFGDVSRDTPNSGLASTVVLQAQTAASAHSTQMTIQRSGTESSTSISGTVSAFKKGDYMRHGRSCAFQAMIKTHGKSRPLFWVALVFPLWSHFNVERV